MAASPEEIGWQENAVKGQNIQAAIFERPGDDSGGFCIAVVKPRTKRFRFEVRVLRLRAMGKKLCERSKCGPSFLKGLAAMVADKRATSRINFAVWEYSSMGWRTKE